MGEKSNAFLYNVLGFASFALFPIGIAHLIDIGSQGLFSNFELPEVDVDKWDERDYVYAIFGAGALYAATRATYDTLKELFPKKKK